MARKKIADKEPSISAEGAAAQAKTQGAGSSTNANKGRAPRSSASAVTHRHKIVTTPESQPAPVIAEEIAAAPLTPEVAHTPAAPKSEPRVVEPPAYEEIAVRAFLLAESRGFVNGTPEGDWLAAESQLWAERTR